MIKSLENKKLTNNINKSILCKRWTIDIEGHIADVTDEVFKTGLENGKIRLSGEFVKVENKHKIWIDAYAI